MALEPELKPSTVDAIRWRLSYVLLLLFQHHRLSEITISEVDRYRAAKVRERDLLTAAKQAGEKIDRRPLSNSTINRTIALLAQILDSRPSTATFPPTRRGGGGASSRPPSPNGPTSIRPVRSWRC